jgi:hypothetical protein
MNPTTFFEWAWGSIYLISTYKEAIGGLDILVPLKEDLCEDPERRVEIPTLVKGAGRPAYKRKRRRGEGADQFNPRKRPVYKCSKCGDSTHTRATCHNQVIEL